MRLGQYLPYLFIFALICLALAAAGIVQPQATQVASVASYDISPQAPLSLVTEPDDGVDVITQDIQNATTSVDLVMYELEDPQVEQALAQAKNRGVTVRVLLDNLSSFGRHPNQDAFNFLQSHTVPVEWSPSTFPLTHQKALIVDGAEATIMTFNLTPQYYGGSRDFAVVDDDPVDISAIEAAFNSDWKHENTPAPAGDDLVWSPGSANTLLDLIQSASSTLDIYNEEMADPRIIDALEAAAARGVEVRVDMSYATNWKSAFQELTSSGVEVRTYASSAKFYIHAKVIIADDTEAFIGSENFSGQSLNSNRELGILIERPDIIDSLETTFEKDWTGSRPFSAN